MATIKDVARLAGVGVGTASRVVSGRGSVSAATAERVRQAIQALDFRPSHAARVLLSGTSQMVGVYIPVLKGTFYTPILQAIDTELRSAGLHMVVAFGSGTGDARQQTLEGMHFLVERGCDGLLVMSNALQPGDLAALRDKQGKVVLLNHSFDDIPDQCFAADHTQGGALAAQALLRMRHRQIAVIGGPGSAPDNVHRIEGFLDELARHGIERKDVLQHEADFSPQGGWLGAEKLLTSGRDFTALFCANDEMAVGALSYFQQIGLEVPHRVSVLGYDDTYSAEYSAPRLTSVHVPWADLTVNALHWLLNACYGMTLGVQREFPVSVSWRASVTPPAAVRTTREH